MNKYRYLAKNTALFALGSFGSKFLSFLFVSLYTAVLTTEEYGVIDLLTTTSSLLLFFVTLNISDAVIRFGLEKKGEQVGIFSYGLHIILKGQLIFGLVLFVIGAFNPMDLPLSVKSSFPVSNFIVHPTFQFSDSATQRILIHAESNLNNHQLFQEEGPF